ncbi:MAG: Hsp20/alpha crystallin family protein [Bacteroidetes bacterium]|nr:Hsp20/alpha crystallin family protein [Bacteroidota bacterium]
MSLIRFNPAFDLLRAEKDINRLFNELANRSATRESNSVWSPLTDVIEEKDQFLLHLDLPGVKLDDIKIHVQDGKLTVSGERKLETETKGKNYHRIERSFGSYFRSFELPKNINLDSIQAEHNNGQLTITLPKAEEAKPKEITIKVK